MSYFLISSNLLMFPISLLRNGATISIQAFTGMAMGALTYSFVQTLEQAKRVSYGHLMLALRNRIGAIQRALGLNRYGPKAIQVPYVCMFIFTFFFFLCLHKPKQDIF